jgi:hypothetical protein
VKSIETNSDIELGDNDKWSDTQNLEDIMNLKKQTS